MTPRLLVGIIHVIAFIVDRDKTRYVQFAQKVSEHARQHGFASRRFAMQGDRHLFYGKFIRHGKRVEVFR